MAAVREINQHEALILTVANFRSFDYADEGSDPLTLLIEMIDSVKKETANLLLEMV